MPFSYQNVSKKTVHFVYIQLFKNWPLIKKSVSCRFTLGARKSMASLKAYLLESVQNLARSRFNFVNLDYT